MAPPPPVTPSPHRFVIKHPAQGQRKAPPAPIVANAELASQLTQEQQFKATPRFSFPGSHAPSPRVAEGNPLLRGFATPTSARPAKGVNDIIEETEEGQDADLDDIRHEYEQVHESIESIGSSAAEFQSDGLQVEEGDYGLPARNPKRRRVLSSSPIDDSQSALNGYGDVQDEGEDRDWEMENLDDEDPDIYESENDHQGFHHDFEDLPSSSANSAISSPPPLPTPRPAQHPPPGSTTAPRFIVPSTPLAASASTPQNTRQIDASFMKPPRFRPPVAEEEQGSVPGTEPLPDAFSPQRRGQKFLPGGLASELVGWVMNLEGNVLSRTGTGMGLGSGMASGSTEEKWLAKILVEDVRGGAGAGMTLVRGRRLSSRDNMGEAAVKIILAGSGASEAFTGPDKVESGRTIGIKGPVWEVSVEGERWGVAVTWDVLGSRTFT